MKKKHLLLLISTALLVSPLSYAEGSFKPHAALTLGGWASKFKQTQDAQKSQVSTLLAPGFSLDLGVKISAIFIEYSICWLVPAYSENPKPRDASYFTLLGLNLGIAPPIIPIEIYGGVEGGNYGLSGGANPDYDGPTLKAGVNIILAKEGRGAIMLKGEYRRFYANSDDAGDLPSDIKTHADIYFVGISLAVR